MKFGKSLSNQVEETIPEWRDKFLSYKELKKKLKQIEPQNDRPAKRQRIAAAAAAASYADCTEGACGGGCKSVVVVDDAMTSEELEFTSLLEDELEKFNTFFVEKEEEYIIRLKELQDRVAKAKLSNEEILKIRKEIVDFHGEMVLLENYSALNYTGLVKILKKYDKRTGALIRLPFIQKVLQQPFFTTDLLYKLVKESERMLDLLFPTNAPSTPRAVDGEGRCDPTSTSTSSTCNDDELLKGPKELAEIEYMKSLYMKSTISALKALKEIRSKSSTVSMFSLPPLQLSGMEETWKKIPILEQVAK